MLFQASLFSGCCWVQEVKARRAESLFPSFKRQNPSANHPSGFRGLIFSANSQWPAPCCTASKSGSHRFGCLSGLCLQFSQARKKKYRREHVILFPLPDFIEVHLISSQAFVDIAAISTAFLCFVLLELFTDLSTARCLSCCHHV